MNLSHYMLINVTLIKEGVVKVLNNNCLLFTLGAENFASQKNLQIFASGEHKLLRMGQKRFFSRAETFVNNNIFLSASRKTYKKDSEI